MNRVGARSQYPPLAREYYKYLVLVLGTVDFFAEMFSLYLDFVEVVYILFVFL
jgi:hypothetical protein